MIYNPKLRFIKELFKNNKDALVLLDDDNDIEHISFDMKNCAFCGKEYFAYKSYVFAIQLLDKDDGLIDLRAVHFDCMFDTNQKWALDDESIYIISPSFKIWAMDYDHAYQIAQSLFEKDIMKNRYFPCDNKEYIFIEKPKTSKIDPAPIPVPVSIEILQLFDKFKIKE